MPDSDPYPGQELIQNSIKVKNLIHIPIKVNSLIQNSVKVKDLIKIPIKVKCLTEIFHGQEPDQVPCQGHESY